MDVALGDFLARFEDADEQRFREGPLIRTRAGVRFRDWTAISDAATGAGSKIAPADKPRGY